MDYRLAQSYSYESEDWWTWSVWLEAPKDQLDDVEYVQYTLHHTFPKPVRRIADRATQFKLTTGGWGTFTIHANVVTKTKAECKLSLDLQLAYPSGSSAPA